ncbi:MAG: AsmA family protein [Sinobacteraceae bacterium]|nr:AsmA family protein [Nevskiaceae bacterium]
MRSRLWIRRVGLAIGALIGTLIVLLVLILAFMDWNRLKPPIERLVSAKLGRTVTLGGNLRVDVWSLTPNVTANDVTVGNPPWEKDAPPLARIERVEIHVKLLPLLAGDLILPHLALSKPEIYLHQDKSGRANWTFENQAPTKKRASGPAKFPVIRDLLIQDGKLMLIDEMRKLKVNGTIVAQETKSQADPTPFHTQGTGTINNQPFEMSVSGGPLVNLNPDHPYPFDLRIKAGDIEVLSNGRVLKPFSLAALDFAVTVSGKDLAEGFYLTQLALPNTPPFKLHVHIARQDMRIAVTDIAGTVGGSDLHGQLNIDATTKRPTMTGDLVSDRLRMQDLAEPLGNKAPTEQPLAQGAPGPKRQSPPPPKAAPANPSQDLFPNAHLQVDRLHAMDADIHFRAKSVDAGQIPFKQVAFRIKLDDGVLAIDPLTFQMSEGRVAGGVRIDARKLPPAAHIDMRVKDIQLDQLKGKSPGAQPPLAGIMEARMVVDGTGDSVHEVMSDANGTFTVVLPQGEVNTAFAELTGIDVAKGLGLLLTKPQDKDPIRCGIAQFDIKKGLMTADNITFDTQTVLIQGTGSINLGPESLDLNIKGQPKKFRLTRLRTPIEVRGHLKKPAFGVNVGSVAKQGAVAAALGAVATPLAAILAFVDPGLAKDQNCAQMIAEAKSKGPPPPTPGAAASRSANEATKDKELR